MKKYDFTKVVVRNIEGVIEEEIKPHKLVADLVYRLADTLDLIEVAREINSGMAVDLTPAWAKEIKRIILGPKSNLWAFTKKAVSDYMDEVEKKKEPDDGEGK